MEASHLSSATSLAILVEHSIMNKQKYTTGTKNIPISEPIKILMMFKASHFKVHQRQRASQWQYFVITH